VNSNRGKRLLFVALVLWAAGLVLAVGAVIFVHRRTAAIVERLAAGDPDPARRALYHQLQADALVGEALDRIESGARGRPRGTAAAPTTDVLPLLEEAERLYRRSLAERPTSAPEIFFYLAEVNFLMGRRRHGLFFLSRYWESVGKGELSRLYAEKAREPERTSGTEPAAETATSPPLGLRGKP